MHYTVYVRGLLDNMVPVEVDYEEMMFKLEAGEELSTAETLLLEQLQPELLDEYYESIRGTFPVDHPII
jgi:hypothetical protein